MSPRLINEQGQQNIINDPSSNKFLAGQPPFLVMSPPHPLIGPGPQQQQPVSGFHPIPMVPRVYMDPMNCSPNGTNVYLPPGQHIMSPPQQQSSPTFPIYYSTSPPTPLTPWIPAAQPPPPQAPYFMLPAHHHPQLFLFQQLI